MKRETAIHAVSRCVNETGYDARPFEALPGHLRSLELQVHCVLPLLRFCIGTYPFLLRRNTLHFSSLQHFARNCHDHPEMALTAQRRQSIRSLKSPITLARLMTHRRTSVITVMTTQSRNVKSTLTLRDTASNRNGFVIRNRA